jgi:predicted DNA-binding protein
METKKNLCAMIPESLHSRVRQEQEALGKTLSELIEQILIEHYEGGRNMEPTKTLAVQISEDLFNRLKEYLHRHKLKQKTFIVELIENALNEEKVNTAVANAEES